MMLNKTAMLIATFFGAGKLPRMPGTWGSLAALPVAWYLWSLPLIYAAPLAVLALVAGVWAAHQYDRQKGGHDNQEIVIDEVLGIFVTTLVCDLVWPQYVAAFVLFRLFDIIKPPPIRWLDDKVAGGIGVVIDDLAAGVYAAIILVLMRLGFEHYHILLFAPLYAQ